MIKYCINCEEQFMLDGRSPAQSNNASDFCSKQCEDEYIASADRTVLDLVSSANPDMRLSDIKALETRLGAKPASSNPSASDIMSNSKVITGNGNNEIGDNSGIAITDEARKAIESLLNKSQS